MQTFACYWLRYPDLRQFKHSELEAHFNTYGQKEGRTTSCGNAENVKKMESVAILDQLLRRGDTEAANARIASIKTDHDDFIPWICYQMRYKDLASFSIDRLKRHYTDFGEQEGRSTSCEGFSIDAIDSNYKQMLEYGTSLPHQSLPFSSTNEFMQNASIVLGALTSDGQCHRNINHVHVFYRLDPQRISNILHATVGLFTKMLRLHPTARHYVKIDCDTFVKDPFELEAFLLKRNPDYWGSCDNTLNFLKINGTSFSYAQGGIYSLSQNVVRPVLREASQIAMTKDPQTVGYGYNEDAMIGAACMQLGIPLTCAGWIVSSFGYSDSSVAYHPHLPKCKLKEVGGSYPITIDIVVAVCRGTCSHIFRDIKFMQRQRMRVRVHLFEKCGSNVACREMHTLVGNDRLHVRALANVGKCDHTFAHFIHNHYGSLSDLTFFAKDTVSSWNVPKTPITSLLSTSTLYGFGCRTPLYTETVQHLRSYLPKWTYASPSVHSILPAENVTFSGISWDAFLREHAMKPVRQRTVCYGGSFVVRKESIRKHDKEFFARIEKTLSRGNNIIESHYMERLWAGLFSESYRLHCRRRCKVCTFRYAKNMFCSRDDYLNVNGCL